jgi:DNA-binding transcriptional ArsR family regulator
MDAGRQLTALADPTRRALYDLVRDRPSTVRELTDQLPISQPAVSQHLRLLREASLVQSEPRGASNVYRADPAGLADLRSWVESLWDDVLDAFTEAARDAAAATDTDDPGE